MNRADFMRQLERLLQGISPMERDEALQYYNDYFDDAGVENEQAVIKALGNPARVAENIKRDLPGSGYGEGKTRKALASDRAVIEYGKETQEASGSEDTESSDTAFGSENTNVTNGAQSASMSFGGENTDMTSGAQSIRLTFGEEGTNSAFGTENRANSFGGATAENGGGGSAKNTDTTWETSGRSVWKKGRLTKWEMPGWAVALLVVVLLFTCPIWLGLIGGVIGAAAGILGAVLGVFACWFGVIVACGAVFLAMLVACVVFVVVGFLCTFSNPWVGMALVGSGLVCGGIGILFLMLTVVMAGIVTPAIFRGIGSLYRLLFKKKAVRGVA